MGFTIVPEWMKTKYHVTKVTTKIATLETKTEFFNFDEKELAEFWKNNQYISAGCSNMVLGKECYCQSAFTEEESIMILQVKINKT